MQNRCVEALELKGYKRKNWILYKFQKLSYIYFHPQRQIFLNGFIDNLFLVESCYKIEFVYFYHRI